MQIMRLLAPVRAGAKIAVAAEKMAELRGAPSPCGWIKMRMPSDPALVQNGLSAAGSVRDVQQKL